MGNYYKDHSITIRSMIKEDAKIFFDVYQSYGWSKDIETYKQYYKEQEEGIRKVFVAEYEKIIVGICTLLIKGNEGPFKENNYPEIIDLSVFPFMRNKGIGNKLLDVAEQEAFKISDIVYLAVGLHSGYGQAQRIYVKRGYNFDGSGAWYNNKQLEQYAQCVNDDSLVLFMYKKR